MATYNELRSLFAFGDLPNRVTVAVVIKGYTILQEASPSAARLEWAEAALGSPESEAPKLLRYVLAANKDQSLAAIQSATDSQVQSYVDAAVDKLHP